MHGANQKCAHWMAKVSAASVASRRQPMGKLMQRYVFLCLPEPYLQCQTMSLNADCISARTKTIGAFHFASLTVLSLHNNEHKLRNEYRIFAHGRAATVRSVQSVEMNLHRRRERRQTQLTLRTHIVDNENEIINFSAYFRAK